MAKSLPQMRCAHCPTGSRAPDDHPCSSGAIWCRPPWMGLVESSSRNTYLGTYLRISLSLTMRLISATKTSLTHTEAVSSVGHHANKLRTLFPDEGVVAVVGVVCITGRCAAAISQNTKVEFCSGVRYSGRFLILHDFNVTDPRTRVRTDPGDRSCAHVSYKHVLERQ